VAGVLSVVGVFRALSVAVSGWGTDQRVRVRERVSVAYIQYEILKDFRVGIISTVRYSAHPRVRILSA